MANDSLFSYPPPEEPVPYEEPTPPGEPAPLDEPSLSEEPASPEEPTLEESAPSEEPASPEDSTLFEDDLRPRKRIRTWPKAGTAFKDPIKTTWTPLELPYFRKNSLLPTRSEIESSEIVLSDRTVQRTVRVGEHFVVKYGTGAFQIEGENLHFVEHNLNINAPRLHAMYRDEDGVLFIIMDYIAGESLETLWPKVSEMDRVKITLKLRPIFKRLRLLPSPGYYGSVSGGPLPHNIFHTSDPDVSINGPFDSEAGLNNGLAKRCGKIRTSYGLNKHKEMFYRHHLSTVFRDHRPTFTHSDVHPANIIVLNQKDFEIWVVDWEDAGWYPSYWEYAAAFLTFKWRNDWENKVEAFITPYPAEAAMLKMIQRDVLF